LLFETFVIPIKKCIILESAHTVAFDSCYLSFIVKRHRHSCSLQKW